MFQLLHYSSLDYSEKFLGKIAGGKLPRIAFKHLSAAIFQQLKREDADRCFCSFRHLRDVFRLVVEAGPVSRRRRRPGYRYIERRDTQLSLKDVLRALFFRTLWWRFREGHAPPWSPGRRGWRRGCHQRWRRGCGQRISRRSVARALQVMIYTWVCVLLCTWSPSVFPIAFAGA